MTKLHRQVAPAELAQHVRGLGAAFAVRIIEDSQLKPEDAGASAVHRTIVCAPVTDETTYAVALHELGHVVAPLGAIPGNESRGSRGLTRDEEHAAWEWARHYALVWTAAMESVARFSEASYAGTLPAPQPDPPEPLRPGARIAWEDYS
jgi:hypothetical protein